jgi:hypothetical protein
VVLSLWLLLLLRLLLLLLLPLLPLLSVLIQEHLPQCELLVLLLWVLSRLLCHLRCYCCCCCCWRST